MEPTTHRRRIAAALLCLVASSAGAPAAGNDVIFSVADPWGDDHGDGSLVYPLRSDLHPGDLDLLELTAIRKEHGTTFRVVFARDVRSPAGEAINSLGTQRDDLARHGFYTVNVDLYIDVDRRPGSGQVAMLPGRRAEVAPPDAWEKVVALTPRPEALRASIHRLRVKEWKEAESRKRTLSRAEVKRRKRQVAEELLPLVYLPNRIRVRGRAIEFFVPAAFLGGSAQPTWAYVVAVSGARLEQRFDVPLLGRLAQESSDGLILPIIPGRDEEAFGGGRENDPLQPPLVDILVPAGATLGQSEILRGYDSFQERRAQVPGVVPADLAARNSRGESR